MPKGRVGCPTVDFGIQLGIRKLMIAQRSAERFIEAGNHLVCSIHLAGKIHRQTSEVIKVRKCLRYNFPNIIASYPNMGLIWCSYKLKGSGLLIEAGQVETINKP